ncbi:MAG TPA: YetF domain-containing protein [Candidatus Limnocylindrales bacterium]|nr:YetF domain-containing protein [Candidatus Limnocylindrales bacterium]
MLPDWLLADPDNLARTVVVGIGSYAALVAMLRLTGKRTLAQMNAFDFIVTVAMGSTLAAIFVQPNVSFVEGVLALGLLLGLQFVVTFATVRSRAMLRLVKNEPKLLLYQGRMLDEALKTERVSPEEVHQAIRSKGRSSVDEVHAVVLETDGTFSVIADAPAGRPTALQGLARPDQDG